jgi:hypothetical protein
MLAVALGFLANALELFLEFHEILVGKIFEINEFVSSAFDGTNDLIKFQIYFRDRFGSLSGLPDGLLSCWTNRTSLSGSFSSNSAHHSANNRADRSCYATDRASGNSTSSLFRCCASPLWLG